MSEIFDNRVDFAPITQPNQPNWINEYFLEISEGLIASRTTVVEPDHVEPPRRYDGLLAFADGVDFDPGLGRGVYYWDSEVDPDGDWVFTGTSLTLALEADDFTTQTPTGLGVPLSVTFGGAQTTLLCDLDAAGLVTFLKDGVYDVTVNVYVNRVGNPGNALLFMRVKANGVPFGDPIAAELRTDGTSQFYQISRTIKASENDTFEMEIIRDSAGADDGQLVSFSSADGWGDGPSAQVRILNF